MVAEHCPFGDTVDGRNRAPLGNLGRSLTLIAPRNSQDNDPSGLDPPYLGLVMGVREKGGLWLFFGGGSDTIFLPLSKSLRTPKTPNGHHLLIKEGETVDVHGPSSKNIYHIFGRAECQPASEHT